MKKKFIFVWRKSSAARHAELVSASNLQWVKKPAFSLNPVTLNSFQGLSAFSLVEMLMALLVASLLLAALAPVMTRRMADNEIKVLSEAANYDKDSVVTIFTDSTEQQEFNIPQDVNRITVTMMGGGGSGGDALYGNKTFTSNGTFTVPEGVTKLRVFMIGGGGGGASGGLERAWETADIPLLNNAEGEILTAGNYTFVNGIIPPDNYKAPELDNKCKISNISANWTIESNNTTIAPNAKFTKFLKDTVITLNKVTACGGGGGGASTVSSRYLQGTGGSGGYKTTQALSYSGKVANLKLIIGDGGKNGAVAAGSTSASGTQGGSGLSSGNWGYPSWCSCSDGGSTSSAGGGGGGSTGIIAGTQTLLEVPGGGGAGGSAGSGREGCIGNGGAGGDGGGPNAGLGGNYAICRTAMNCTIGSKASGYVSGTGNATLYSTIEAGGGAGGGGKGGTGGGVATLGGYGGMLTNSIFNNTTNCTGGGVGGSNGAGKPGAIHLWYSAAAIKNGLKCQYYKKSNSGGGGAAGQISVGEISVTPGEVLTFEIGAGGLAQSVSGKNGNNGKATYIKRGASAVMSANGGYGGEYSSSETTPSQGGSFRNPVIGVNWTGIDYRNNNTYAAGSNGNLASDSSNTSYGGAGGYSQDIKGNLIAGGIGGNTSKDGLSPLTNNYGAGGGGGSGSQTVGDNTFGKGGAGASGYIYVEWGGSNGGGGTAGEIVQKTLTNFEQNDRKMVINIGKGGDSSINGGKGGDTNISVKSGGKNVAITARGGTKGENGYTDKGSHGLETKYPDNYSDTYKEFITENMNIISGQKGSNDYGGIGGYINCLYKGKDAEGNTQCAQTIQSNDGLSITAGPIRPGCGGTSITAPLYDSICIPYSINASPNGGNGTFGAGGGGGAVLNSTQGKGGKGGDGFVILEYKSVL